MLCHPPISAIEKPPGISKSEEKTPSKKHSKKHPGDEKYDRLTVNYHRLLEATAKLI
jgi:hypothetical protein